MKNLVAELRRRHVFRVAGMYAVVGWLLMQLASHFENSLNLPAWFDTLVTVLVLIGFPLALIIAWAFDLTPEGVRRTPAAGENDTDGSNRSRKPGWAILIGLLIFAGTVAWLLSRPAPETAEHSATVAADDRSIAVLPFVPLSGNADDAYFGKGLAEELLNALAKFPELKVAARTSAFSFEGRKIDLREVGRQLGVAHVLEGSVRSSGEKVRVTVQLIRANDGFHLWSETYDRDMSDLFVVQDEIVAAINRTLQIRLGVGVGTARAAGKQVTPQAYQNYLRGLELWGTRADPANRKEAIRLFQLCTVTDPGFADGWAAYGVSLVYSVPRMSGLTAEQHYQTANDALERALTLDPDNVRALSGLAASLMTTKMNLPRATELAARAVDIAPNAAFPHYAHAWALELRGEDTASNQAYERAIALDPLNTVLRRVRALHYYAAKGDYAGVVAAADDCAKCSQDDHFVFAIARYMAARRGGTDEQVRQSAASLNAMLREMNDRSRETSMDVDMALYLGLSDPAFVEWLLGGPRPPQAELAWMNELTCDTCNLDTVNMVAAVGEYDIALAMLERAALNQGDALFYIIDPVGRDAWPDEFRRHPRFHAYWSQPHLQQVAEILRDNGKTNGLPLDAADHGGSMDQ